MHNCAANTTPASLANKTPDRFAKKTLDSFAPRHKTQDQRAQRFPRETRTFNIEQKWREERTEGVGYSVYPFFLRMVGADDLGRPTYPAE